MESVFDCTLLHWSHRIVHLDIASVVTVISHCDIVTTMFQIIVIVVVVP